MLNPELCGNYMSCLIRQSVTIDRQPAEIGSGNLFSLLLSGCPIEFTWQMRSVEAEINEICYFFVGKPEVYIGLFWWYRPFPLLRG
jgi:hypothetical protein